MSDMNGYKEADTIDRTINSLIAQFPIRDNTKSWLTFSRTIKTTCDILEHAALIELKKKRINSV